MIEMLCLADCYEIAYARYGWLAKIWYSCYRAVLGEGRSSEAFRPCVGLICPLGEAKIYTPYYIDYIDC